MSQRLMEAHIIGSCLVMELSNSLGGELSGGGNADTWF